ncbi:hypothetical protein SBADM41S_00064 [Streptomyces badius]
MPWNRARLTGWRNRFAKRPLSHLRLTRDPRRSLRTVLHAVRRAVDEDALRAPVPARVRVERGPGPAAAATTPAPSPSSSAPPRCPPWRSPASCATASPPSPASGGSRSPNQDSSFFTLDAPGVSDRAVLAAVREQGLAYGHGGRPPRRGPPAPATRGTGLRTPPSPPRPSGSSPPRARRVRATCGQVPGPARGPPRRRPIDGHGDTSRTAHRDPARSAPEAIRGGAAGAARARRRPLGPPAPRPDTTAPRLGRRPCSSSARANPLFRVRYAHGAAPALVTRGAAALGFTAEAAAHATHGGGPAPCGAQAENAEPAPYGEIGTEPTRGRRRRPPTTARRSSPTTPASGSPEPVTARPTGSPGSSWKPSPTLPSPFPLPPSFPRGDEKPSAAHRARLALAEAAGTVLAGP